MKSKVSRTGKPYPKKKTIRMKDLISNYEMTIQFQEKPLIFRNYSLKNDPKKLVATLFTKMNSEEGINELRKGDKIFDNSDQNYRLVAEYEDELVATITLFKNKNFDKNKIIDMYSVVTAESLHGTGISQKFFKFACSWIKNMKGNSIELSTHVTNSRAQNFYRKLGFKEKNRTNETVFYHKKIENI